MASENSTSPDRWVNQYADALFRYAIVRVNDREAARDLVQETFLSALQNLASFKGESSEKTWLTAILKNKIIDRYRRAATSMVALSDPADAAELDQFFDEEGEWKSSAGPSDWSASPHEQYRSKEFHEILRKCLATLKAQWRSIFTLKYLEEMDSEDICKELGISASNYWVIMHRAKLMLRRCVEKNWLHA